MDWDWEEGPPRDAPRRRPEEPPQGPAPEGPAPDTTFSGAIEHFERPSPPERTQDVPPADPDAAFPPYLDDERTQIIRRPAQDPEPLAPADDWPEDSSPAPDAASFAAAIDRFETSTPAPYPGRGPEGRAPSASVDRAARRARRRRQVRRRRLTALAIVVVIVVLLVVFVVRGCGGPAEGQAAMQGPVRSTATHQARGAGTADAAAVALLAVLPPTVLGKSR